MSTLAAVAFWGHATYPVLVRSTAAIKNLLGPPSPALSQIDLTQYDLDRTPPFTVVIPAYLESSTICAAVLQWKENGAQDVVVVVDEDPDTEIAARVAGAKVLVTNERAGKAAALNRAIPTVETPVVLLTDANTQMTRQSALRMVSHVAAGRADVVGGVKSESLAESESRYWRFENAMKAAEEDLGGSPILVGEAIALRPEDWEDIPSWVRVDDLYFAARAVERGLDVRVDTSCVAAEPSAQPDDQHVRRVKMASGVVELVLRYPRGMLRSDRPRLMILGHKVARLTISPAAQLLLAAKTARSFPQPLGAVVAAAQLAPAGDYLASARRNRPMRGLRGLVDQAAGMPVVVWVDSIRQLPSAFRNSDGTWDKVAR